MKILLVIPDNPSSARFQLRTAGITPPLGVAYLASHLSKNNFKVSVLDNSVEHLCEKDFIKLVQEFNPNIVGFSALTYAVPDALNLARIVKKIDSQIKVIMGGAHCTALPKEILKDEVVDIVVKGEGEETILDLSRTLSEEGNLRNVKGIMYKISSCIIDTGNRHLIEDIDSIPFPAYELLPMDKYFLPASRRHSNRKIGSIITMRGCPYSCAFCSNRVFGKYVRFRKPESVIEEIELLVKKYNLGEFVIWDDNFNLDQKRAVEICSMIKRKKINIVWSCNNRANLFSEELCCALRDAGCHQVNFGIESGVQELRNRVKKGITSDDIEKAIGLCRKYKLLVSCSFIFGIPGETWETALQTLKFAKQINPDYVMFCMLVPMPGSELFDFAVSNGLIDKDKENWERYVTLLSALPPVISMCNLTKKELAKLQKKVFRDFYLKPRYIWHALLRIRSFEDWRQALRGLYAILSHQIATNSN